MVMGQYFVIIPKHNHAMVLKAKRAYNEREESLKDFSANAIFDSGSQVSLTGCKCIIHDFRELDEPMIAEGVLDTEVKYMHGGDVNFVMPGDVRKATHSTILMSQRPSYLQTCGMMRSTTSPAKIGPYIFTKMKARMMTSLLSSGPTRAILP